MIVCLCHYTGDTLNMAMNFVVVVGFWFLLLSDFQGVIKLPLPLGDNIPDFLPVSHSSVHSGCERYCCCACFLDHSVYCNACIQCFADCIKFGAGVGTVFGRC